MKIPLLLLLALHLHASATIECLTSTGYATSTPTTLCAECELLGNLLANGTCNYPIAPPPPPAPGAISSLCPVLDLQAYCQVTVNGTCLLSLFGARCIECGELGFLSWNQVTGILSCNCYSAGLSPLSGCQQSPLDNAPTYTNLTVDNVVYTKVSCEAFQNEVYGCFAPVNNSEHKYGTPNPPIPDQCCSQFLGPPPGVLTESLLTPGEVTQYQECNEHGGLDADFANYTVNHTLSWQSCSNHGSWNATYRNCTCFEGWALLDMGEIDPTDGAEIYSCGACAPGFGPDSLGVGEPPYCVAIYMPDPLTGITSECSGHGLYMDSGCVCFNNATMGVWELIPVGDPPVQTCAKCLSNCPTL